MSGEYYEIQSPSDMPYASSASELDDLGLTNWGNPSFLDKGGSEDMWSPHPTSTRSSSLLLSSGSPVTPSSDLLRTRNLFPSTHGTMKHQRTSSLPPSISTMALGRPRTGMSPSLLGGGNTQLSQALRQCELLEGRVNDLETALGQKSAEHETLKHAYDGLLDAVRNLGNIRNTIDEKPALTSYTIQPPELANVRYWGADEWTAEYKANGTAALGFITDADGRMISDDTARQIRVFIGAYWKDWIPTGDAPDSWRKLGAATAAKFYRAVEQKFPAVGYCSGNWKADKLGLMYYPAFWQSHSEKIKAARQEKRDSEIEKGALALHLSSGQSIPVIKREPEEEKKKRKGDEHDSRKGKEKLRKRDEPPSKSPSTAPTKPVSNTIASSESNEIPDGIVVDPPSQPDTSLSQSGQKANDVDSTISSSGAMDIDNPPASPADKLHDSEFVPDCQESEVVRGSLEESISSKHDDDKAPVEASESPKEPNTLSPSDNPKQVSDIAGPDFDYTKFKSLVMPDTGVGNILTQQTVYQEAPPLPTAPATEQGDSSTSKVADPAKGKGAGKPRASNPDAKMTASKSLTGRNLCCIPWIKKFKGTRQAFAKYWDDLPQAERDSWDAKALAAKAAKKTAAVAAMEV